MSYIERAPHRVNVVPQEERAMVRETPEFKVLSRAIYASHAVSATFVEVARGLLLAPTPSGQPTA